VKITHTKLDQHVRPTSHGTRGVTICAELDGPREFMTITVSVPNRGSEEEVCERGVARAREFAKGFADVPLACFPIGTRRQHVARLR
jgi:hypothetical protein